MRSELKDPNEIIQKQKETIESLQDEIYRMRLTGEVTPLKYHETKAKAFKKFLKRNAEFKKAVRDRSKNKIKTLKCKIDKYERLLQANGGRLSNLHITGNRYVRIATYMDNVEELLSSIVNCKDEQYILQNGYKVNPKSLRYQTFNKDLACANCGIKGRFLALERCLSDKGGNEGEKEGQGFHLNLYGIDEMGREVLMTKDHIIPKSKGGPDSLDNLQTMCTYCNEEKGDKLPND